MSIGMKILGPLFIAGFYALLMLHIYAYFIVIMPVLKKRLGTSFGILWVGIGLSLVYNISFNHFFAAVIKAGSPKDLKIVEQKRKLIKQRENRSGVSEIKD